MRPAKNRTATGWMCLSKQGRQRLKNRVRIGPIKRAMSSRWEERAGKLASQVCAQLQTVYEAKRTLIDSSKACHGWTRCSGDEVKSSQNLRDGRTSSMTGPRQERKKLSKHARTRKLASGAGSFPLVNEPKISLLRSAGQGCPCRPQPQCSWRGRPCQALPGYPPPPASDHRVMCRFVVCAPRG